MPHTAKPIPRPCPRCGGVIRQKYVKYCGRCNAQLRREKKERKKFMRELKDVLDYRVKSFV